MSKPTAKITSIAERSDRSRPGGADRARQDPALESIHATCGSISGRGPCDMDMSYKRAWDLVDELNRICGRPAVARQTGGKNGGGAALTPFGLSLVERYRSIERAATGAARKQLLALRSEIGRPKKTPAA